VKPAVSIVIPVYNALEYARRCLESVYQAATRVEFEVIVVDNGSAPEVAAWLSSEMQRREALTVVTYDRPLGFPKAVNEGVRAAKHGFLVLLNSDSAVTDWWLDGLVEAIETDARIGLASPVTNQCGPGRQLVASRPESGSRHPLIDEPRLLFFFCVMIRRELWQAMGGLDEIFQVGNYEDDDFCLRARMAGWRFFINPNVFIFNEESKTFEENQIDHEEWLFRNEKVFLEKASRVSRSPAPLAYAKCEAPPTSVIVAVAAGTKGRVADSLASLANQTVTGFEAVIVSTHELVLPKLPHLTVRHVRVPETSQCNAGHLWNAGIEAARGSFLAYLPAGDIYLPYHLEILHGLLAEKSCDAAYTGWGVAIHRAGKVRRAAVTNWEGRLDRLIRGPWAPLLCWMHHRSFVPEKGFRDDLASFTEWDFALRLSRTAKVWFEPGVTCERNRWTDDVRESPADAESVMNAFPVSTEAARQERDEFLDALKSGIWEETLLAERRELEQRARRVRRLLNKKSTLQTDALALHEARRRLDDVNAVQVASQPTPGTLDFIFLSTLRWADLTQRQHHFATGLAKRGYRVFWADVSLMPASGFTGTIVPRKVADNLFEIHLPGFGGDIYHFVWNRAVLELMTGVMDQLRKACGIGQAIQLVNFPGWTPLAKSLRQRFGWPILYDCLDDQNAFSELFGQAGVAAYETEITQTCDFLTASGHNLHEMKLRLRKDAVLIRNAADYTCFSAASADRLLDGFPHPIIGFFGAFADWLDSDWVAEAGRRFAAWTFVYVGSETFAREENRARWLTATSAPNVHVLPRADHPKLSAYLSQFDICIMPFQDLPITRSMHAVKIYEYLSAGKHVVVPALPETKPFAEAELLFTYENHEQSFRLLEKLACEPPSTEQIMARKAFAAANDWSERIDRLIDVARGKARTEQFNGVSGGDGGLGENKQQEERNPVAGLGMVERGKQ